MTDAAGVTQAVLDAGMSPKFVDLVTVRPGHQCRGQGWRGQPRVCPAEELVFWVGAKMRHLVRTEVSRLTRVSRRMEGSGEQLH